MMPLSSRPLLAFLALIFLLLIDAEAQIDEGDPHLRAETVDMTRGEVIERPRIEEIRELPDLTLLGEGTLRGRVLDRLGRPVPRRELRARSITLPEKERAGPAGTERGRGTREGEASTDDQGRFEITGLEPGRYRLYTHVASFPVSDFELEPSPIATGGEEHELRETTSRIELRVLGPAGEPVELEVKGVEYRPGRRPPSAWIALRELGTDGRPFLDTITAPPVIAGAPDHFCWQVEAGRHYVAVVLAPPHPLLVQRLEIPADGDSVRRDLPLAEPVACGGLSLRVSSPFGRLHGGGPVAVLEAATRVPVWSARCGAGADVDTSVLPAGRYLLRATSEPEMGPWDCGTDYLPARFTPAERIIDFTPGNEIEVEELTLGLGGRIELHSRVDAEPTPAVTRLLRQLDEGLEPFDHHHLWRGDHPGGGSVELVPRNGEPPRQLGFFPLESTDPVRWGHFFPGRPALLYDPLPPGRHRLRVTLPGCKPVEREVEIEADRVTPVEVVLE